MAEFIPRDVGSPFDPKNAEQLAEFHGFASDVPSDEGMIAAVNDNPVPLNSHSLRAGQLLRPDFLLGANLLPTPDPVPAGSLFERQGMSVQVVDVPGFGPVNVWSFDADVNNGEDVDFRIWPASTMRIREGRLVHSFLQTRSGMHTIHHHGIEPTTMNDGVGHISFDVSREYTYQWQAAQAGTYFYHCHRNTTLHFEMGMYGMLIIDPDVVGAPFADGGAGQCHVGDALEDYAAEAIWAADDFDLRWHGIDRDGNGRFILDHDAGIQKSELDEDTGLPSFVAIDDLDNPHLHDFRPDVFLVSGVAAPYGQNWAVIASANAGTPLTPRVRRGQKLLVRALNASYTHTRWEFPTVLPGRVIAADGRTFGRAPFGSYSEPFTLASINHRFLLSTAQRWDILLDIPLDARVGSHYVRIHYTHSLTNVRLRTVRLRIDVTA